ncbi:permease [Marichromatium purpuratum 984]|uniref:Lipopolysaccharide export system permease protein LptF n=1 Tax=Marichromatium purpuratum 984 TaxID=765910 RepID=W0E0A4_MARPU|nr:LPS export ABC transporter permease LptF [Marichromatium purpuratum]AHF04285.1 permease [Marichromatium purpuratum 984]
MLGIVDRYVLREVTKVFLAIVLTLALIVASMLLLRTFEEVNVGALSVTLVFRFLGYQLVRDASSLLPPAFFLAALVTLSRLARDSELIAMHACGLGPSRTYRALLLLAVPVAALTAWFALVLQPWAATGIQDIRMQQKEQAAQIAGLQPGRFYVEEEGDVVVYIGAIDRHRSLGDVFLLDRRGGTNRMVVSEGGVHRLEEVSGDHLVTLTSGYRFDGNPGEAAFMIGDFDAYEIRIRAKERAARARGKRSTVPTSELRVATDLADRVEFEHRLGAPLAIFTLAVLAIPLVAVSPRQSSTGRLALAFLAYFSFFNFQRLAEGWLEDGVTPLWLTSQWYQLLILAVVYLALLPDSLWARRVFGRWRRAPR